jgi:hypothetical protein
LCYDIQIFSPSARFPDFENAFKEPGRLLPFRENAQPFGVITDFKPAYKDLEFGCSVVQRIVAYI